MLQRSLQSAGITVDVTTRLEVPTDQLSLAREQRQFPFRAASEAEQFEVRHASGEAITGVDALIRKIVNDRSPAGFTQADKDDASQEIKIHLLVYALPRYDAWRIPKVKVSTFLGFCSTMQMLGIVRRHIKQKRHESIDDISLCARDYSDDRLIERLADRVNGNPTLISKHGQTILNPPSGMSNAQRAALAGLAESSLPGARYDARQRAIKLLDRTREEIF